MAQYSNLYLLNNKAIYTYGTIQQSYFKTKRALHAIKLRSKAIFLDSTMCLTTTGTQRTHTLPLKRHPVACQTTLRYVDVVSSNKMFL